MKIMVMTGSLDSIWTKEFIAKVLIPMGHEIYVQGNPLESGCFEQFYIENNVNIIYPYVMNKFLMKIPIIRKWHGYYRRYVALKKEVDFDYIICLFVNPFFLKCAEKIAFKSTKIIPCFIGSDLFRARKLVLNKISRWIKDTESICVCGTEKLNDFYKENILERGADKVIGFGISQIEEIDRIAVREENQKETFLGIDCDYTTIAIGYNGSLAMQHNKVLDIIDSIEEIKQKKVCLVLPMTYQKHKLYTKKLKAKLENMGIKYLILEDFLDSRGMARLWLSVDIFIHAQTSDSFSASMLESIYAGCEVINGSWLKYQELDNWGIQYSRFEEFNELTHILKEKIYNFKRNECKNKALIRERASWENCRKEWEVLFSKAK